MSDILKTGIKNSRNVLRYMFGSQTLLELKGLLDVRRVDQRSCVVFFVDHYFKDKTVPENALSAILPQDKVIHIDSSSEPTTTFVNHLRDDLVREGLNHPCAIVGIGGGATLDVAKAVSNLLTNGGYAEHYQGWDLVKKPGIYKIAVPTLSGTGAEATRTCVMTNPKNGLKLGMNSDFTVYDQILLDPDLTSTVPRNQYFYTGMDAYIHCMESLSGSYRNAIGDAYSDQTIRLCREVFHSEDMMDDESRAKLMVASYLGGCAIATSYVGLVHPFSAGLSVVLGIHHCVANCIVMRAMEEFYPEGYREFWEMAERQNVEIPKGVCQELSEEQYEQLYNATVIHEKPLTNALGENYKNILTPEKVREVFQKM